MSACRAFFVVFFAMAGVTGAYADDDVNPNNALICHEDAIQIDSDRLLRALSLDLRGRLPTMAEVESLDGLATDEFLPEGLIDSWLSGSDFAAQAVRRHRQFFWNNISNVDLINRENELRVNGGIIFADRRSRYYRTGNREQIRCLDEPAQFDEAGLPIPMIDENGYRREGWVEVAPYWAPETTVRVCAYDAQDRLTTRDGTRCEANGGRGHMECGCGPNLRWCATPQIEQAIQRSLARSLDRLVQWVMEEQQSYLALFTTRRMFLDGPLVHWYRHLSKSAQIRMSPTPIESYRLPNIPYDEATFRPIELSTEHSGVLTHPSYLLRFQTNRARANRFYESFLCTPFVPPDGGLPAASEESALNPDLQRRAGCKYCHVRLEPAAAHWGRWSESGIGFLSPDTFPAFSQGCLDCAEGRGGCTSFCRTYYLTRPLSDLQTPYLGMLNAYAYRRGDHMHFIEEGPKLLARRATTDNQFPLCVARQTAEWLSGRATSEKDTAWLHKLAINFVQSGFSYQDLVKQIVSSPQYRRVR